MALDIKEIEKKDIGSTTIIGVELKGEIDEFTSPSVKERINAGIRDNPNFGAKCCFIVDLSEVQYLEGTGLGILIGGLKRAREKGGALDLVLPNPRIRRIFDITGLDKIFSIHTSWEEAEKEIGARN